MAVMPIVRLFFPCAHIEENAENGSITIVDPIDSIFVPADAGQDFSLGPIFLCTHVREGLGTFYFRVEVVDAGGRLLSKSKPRELAFSTQNHNSAEELVFRILSLRLRSPGVIQFVLFANEVPLAHWDLRVIALGE